MLNSSPIQAERQGAVATVRFNRPRVLNCINEQWLQEFRQLIEQLAADESLRVIVLRGEGRAFCTGIDLTALANGAISPSFFREWEAAVRRLETIDALVVAAIHSHCIGGGLQLALACDLRLARSDARFGITAIKEGIIPGMGMWRLARQVGVGRAKRLALTADVVSAGTALEWGLVDEVVSPEQFEERISALTARVLEMAWTSTRLTKKLVNAACDVSGAEFTEMFCEYQRQALQSPEHRAAMAARRQAEPARAFDQ